MSNPGRVNASVSPTTRYRGPATAPQASSALVSLAAVSEPAPAAPAPGVVILSVLVISSLLGPLADDVASTGRISTLTAAMVHFGYCTVKYPNGARRTVWQRHLGRHPPARPGGIRRQD